MSQVAANIRFRGSGNVYECRLASPGMCILRNVSTDDEIFVERSILEMMIDEGAVDVLDGCGDDG